MNPEKLSSYENGQFEEFLQALMTMLKQHDTYTFIHQEQVAKLAKAIAMELKLPKEQVTSVYYGSLVHDIGKIYISTEILNKPAPLSPEEYELMKTHCLKGYEIIKNIKFPGDVSRVLLQHHERQDGSGYPQGLKGDHTSLEAKIVAVADVVEAMSFERPYRKALGVHAALREIVKNRGKLYDPEVVDACVAVFKEKKFHF